MNQVGWGGAESPAEQQSIIGGALMGRCGLGEQGGNPVGIEVLDRHSASDRPPSHRAAERVGHLTDDLSAGSITKQRSSARGKIWCRHQRSSPAGHARLLVPGLDRRSKKGPRCCGRGEFGAELSGQCVPPASLLTRPPKADRERIRPTCTWLVNRVRRLMQATDEARRVRRDVHDFASAQKGQAEANPRRGFFKTDRNPGRSTFGNYLLPPG